MRLEKVLWPNKYMMSFMGIWPIRPDTGLARRIFIFFRIFVAISAMVCLLVPHIMTVMVHWGNLTILGELGGLILVYSLGMFKMLYYLVRHQSYGCMYQYIKDFWNISNDAKERQNYENLANIAKLVTLACVISGMGDLFMFEAVALITWMKYRHEISEGLHRRPLPMELSYGFDTQQTPTYEIIFIIQSICMIYAITAVVGGDCTMMVLILHVTGQFRLINFRFRMIGNEIGSNLVSKSDAFHAEVAVEIGKCVAHHQHTIRVAKELNSLLSPIIFAQIMISGLEICLAGYAVIEGENSGVELMKFFVTFVSLLVQLVVWCWPGELLIQESTAIADTIYYEVPWFKLPPKQQRDLNIIILRAQKECHVTAFYQVMSIRKLTEVINAAGSYMALLKSMKR